MARSFLWRRVSLNYPDTVASQEATSGGYVTSWTNVATLTPGQTLTRFRLQADFVRRADAAGEFTRNGWHEGIQIGAYVALDPLTPPTLDPRKDCANQSWFYWESSGPEADYVTGYDDTYRLKIRFRADVASQRKAKGTGTDQTAVWLVWTQFDYFQATAAGWTLNSIGASTGVLLP